MWRRANKVHLFTIDSHCFQVLLLLYWTWQSSGNQAYSAYFKPITRPVLLVVCNISDNLVCSSNLIARENCKQILLLPAMGTQSNCNRIAYKFSHQHFDIPAVSDPVWRYPVIRQSFFALLGKRGTLGTRSSYILLFGCTKRQALTQSWQNPSWSGGPS